MFFLFFLLLLRPPPTSTLFPYTTLFRSRPDVSGVGSRRVLVRSMVAKRGSDRLRGGRHHRATTRLREDRKSTRLNSSHITISYAVFCLKKKKNKVQNQTYHRSSYAPNQT